MTKYYVFCNQYDAKLYEGYHHSEENAWHGFFKECEYPESERNIEAAKQQGVFFYTLK